jgi:nitrite reductase/ring-hydroxylating ferredoxin subunit
VVSLSAQILDLVGDEASGPTRPSVDEALSALAPGEVRAARTGDTDVVVAVTASGRAVVVADRCPHDGGPMSDGFVEGETLVCGRHGWTFELDGGRALGQPGRRLEVLQPPCGGRCDRAQGGREAYKPSHS